MKNFPFENEKKKKKEKISYNKESEENPAMQNGKYIYIYKDYHL